MLDQVTGSDLLAHLIQEAKAIQGETNVIDSINRELDSRRKAATALNQEWENRWKTFRQTVGNGAQTTGDLKKDYVVVNGLYCYDINIEQRIQQGMSHLEDMLNAVNASRFFWSVREKFDRRNTGVYEGHALDSPAYTLTPEQIVLRSVESLVVHITPILDGQTTWVFSEVEGRKEFPVRLENFSGDYNHPILTELSTSRKEIEKLLKDEPFALLRFYNHHGREVPADVKDAAEKQMHEAAKRGALLIEETFDEIKKSDQRIMQIEGRITAPGQEIGATRPEIHGPEFDEFMAAIISRPHRDQRDWSLRKLAIYMQDLQRTGLVNYTRPIEIREKAGKMRVYNLAELTAYIGKILEISEEEKRVPSSAA